MKKLLAMLLALTMVLSLAACGGDDTPKRDDDEKETTAQTGDSNKNDDNSTEASDPIKSENNDTTNPETIEPPAQNDTWSFKEMGLPQIPALKLQEKEGYTLIETPISCDVEELCAYMQTLPCFENYSSVYYTRSEAVTFSRNEVFAVTITDAITLIEDRGTDYIKIEFTTSPYKYLNYSDVSILITEIELTADLQNALMDSFDHAGLEPLKFALQGKDLDGKQSNGESFRGDQTADSMGEQIAQGDYTYGLRRSFLEGENYYTFGYWVADSYEKNYRAGDVLYTPSYQTLPYQLSDQYKQDFGGNDPFDCGTFGNELLTSLFNDYHSSVVDSLEYSTTKFSSGAISVKIGCRFTYDNGSDDDLPNFEIGFSYNVEDGVVTGTSANAEVSGIEQTKQGSSKECLFNESLGILKMLYPDIDTSRLSYNENERYAREEVSLNVLGTEVKTKVIIRYMDEDLMFSL